MEKSPPMVLCARAVTPEEAYRILGVERGFLLEAVDLLARWRRSSADRSQLVEEIMGLRARHDRLMDAEVARLNWTTGGQMQWMGITTGVTGAMKPEPLSQEKTHPQLVEDAKWMQARHDRLTDAQAARLNQTTEGQPQRMGITTGVTGVTKPESLPQETDHPQLVEEVKWLQARHNRLMDAEVTRLNWTTEGQLQWMGITTGVMETTKLERLSQDTDSPPREDQEGTKGVTTAGWLDWTNVASDEMVMTGEMVDLLRQEAPSAEDLHQLADEFRRIWRLHKRRFDQLDTDKDASKEK